MTDPKTTRGKKSRRGGRKRPQRPGERPTMATRRKPQNGKPQQRTVAKGQLPDNFIYGINPVSVALDNQQLKVLFFDNGRSSERLQHLHAQAQAAGVDIRPLQRQGWQKVLASEMHQGVAGILLEAQPCYLEEVVAEAGEDSCILVLDRIQDPQNLGAVFRTAAACGVDAVVLPKAGGCPITPAVHKASAGMSLVVHTVEDENLARAIEFLKDNGYWVVGCDSGGGENATLFEYPQKRVIVMGNEAEGMRRLVRDSCDYLVKIPMARGVESLNISVAAGIVLYLAQADLARAEMEAEAEPSNGELDAEIKAD